MLDDGNDLNLENPDGQPPEEKGNRTFLVVGGLMAGLVFLTLVCMAVYFLVIAPRLTAQKNAAQATIEAGNAQAIQQLTATAEAALWTPTLQPTPLQSPTIQRTSTPVIALNTATQSPTADMATLAAMQTQLAFQMTSTAAALGTRGVGGQGMPTTGFFDEVGLPSMIILAVTLIAVIFLARRMRKAPIK
jgi:ABC-type antimicrobial peptide transport system permease subunit